MTNYLRNALVGLAALSLAALSLAACSSTTGSSSAKRAPATTLPPSTTTAKATATATAAAWCALQLGQDQASVVAALGEPDGSDIVEQARAIVPTMPEGYSVQGWHLGKDLLLVTYNGGEVANLQAYSGVVGPVGASDLGCAAFRN